MKPENEKNELIYKKLSFEIVGALFDTYNELGPNHPEKTYCNALKLALKDKELNFISQQYLPAKYKEERVAIYFPDFVIEDKIVLELKVRPIFSKRDFEQVKRYLKQGKYKLGILATFCLDGVKFARVLNLY